MVRRLTKREDNNDFVMHLEKLLQAEQTKAAKNGIVWTLVKEHEERLKIAKRMSSFYQLLT